MTKYLLREDKIMYKEEIIIVYNDKYLGIFTNFKLAIKKLNQIKGEFETYTSPALMYYRLLELFKEHNRWENKLVSMNVLVDMLPQEQEEQVEYVWKGYHDMGRNPIFNSNFYMEENSNEFIKG